MKSRKIVNALAALGNPSRFEVFMLLMKQPKGQGVAAGDISEQLNIPPTTTSFHLTQLRNAGLISSIKDGRNIYYHAETKRIKKIAKIIAGKKSRTGDKYEIL